MNRLHKKMEINTEFITLGQLLKLANIFESGGMIKGFLQEQGVLLNGEREHRRGKKLFEHDVVEIERNGSYVIVRK
ncbi:S4 domain-containing protein YaaA [Lentibacillus sp. N15]|uniref:S4 domain-containing protein YaaA n=1 Tax=Lentibacillus songyuanensis TaxID=3136161 RepID=UPI0031BAEFE3